MEGDVQVLVAGGEEIVLHLFGPRLMLTLQLVRVGDLAPDIGLARSPPSKSGKLRAKLHRFDSTVICIRAADPLTSRLIF